MSEPLLRRAYRLLARAYPPEFRADVGVDMEETFVDRYRAARENGRSRTLTFLLLAAVDVVSNGLRERFTFNSTGMLHWSDVRYAFRLLRRSPAFSAMTLVVLSGGLGLSIFTFSFLYTAMIKPLPLPGGDEIVSVQEFSNGSTRTLQAVDVVAIRGSITTLTNVGIFANQSAVLGDDEHRRSIGAFAVESNMFDLTRTRPILGRALQRDDQLPGAEPVIVLGHWAWRVLFGSDSTIIGRRVPMNTGFVRVVGVMPEGFGFPVAADAWTPIANDLLSPGTKSAARVGMYARLARGASIDAADAELSQLLVRVSADRVRAPNDPPLPTGAAVQSFPMAQMGDEGPYVFALLNIVATLILLLACINVLNLLLARANERARETAVRLALGASRGRLMMQSMWESIVLCVAGGVLATGIAAWGLDAINAWLQSNLERNLAFWWVWHLDRAAIIAAGGFVTLAIATLGGVVSARVAGTHFQAVLRDGGARSGNRREGRVARLLVVTQVATVSVLMFFGVMSGVVAVRVANVDFGYDTKRVLMSGIEPTEERFATRAARAAFYQRVLELAEQPAVEGTLLRADLADANDPDARFILGVAAPIPLGAARAYIRAVDGAFSTIGITMRAGRAFDARDDQSGAPVALISASLAATRWPGRSPIGEPVHLAVPGDSTVTRTVVGVVSDILLGSPFSRVRSTEAIYIPLQQTDARGAKVFFRHRGNAAAAQAALYRTTATIDPRSDVPDVFEFEEMLTKSNLIARSVMKLFAACFGFALILAVSGTYGLMARSIGQRTREIGIRRALGATDRGVVQMLLGQGSRQLGIGVAIATPLMLGVGVGFWMYFPVGLAIPVVGALLVSAVIVGVVLAATYLPTRRALGVTVTDALRADG
jgi:predicted permease